MLSPFAFAAKLYFISERNPCVTCAIESHFNRKKSIFLHTTVDLFLTLGISDEKSCSDSCVYFLCVLLLRVTQSQGVPQLEHPNNTGKPKILLMHLSGLLEYINITDQVIHLVK